MLNNVGAFAWSKLSLKQIEEILKPEPEEKIQRRNEINELFTTNNLTHKNRDQIIFTLTDSSLTIEEITDLVRDIKNNQDLIKDTKARQHAGVS